VSEERQETEDRAEIREPEQRQEPDGRQEALELEEHDEVRLHIALEAILFSSNRPLKVRELQSATDTDRTAVEQGLDELRQALEGRGLMVQRQGDLVLLVTRPELASYVRRALRPEVTGRLSPAAYETLAIVAYQQPVTRSRVEEIRGVNSDSVMSNLEMRDLVVEVGRVNGPGQARLYGTTMRFLQVMGLESLEELPAPPGIEPAPPRDGESTSNVEST
jgi:segregation and condensation protein B